MCVLNRCSEVFDRLSISRPETFISSEFLRHFGPLSHTPALSKYPRMSKIHQKPLCTSLNLKSEARIKVPKCKSWPNPFLWNRTNPLCYGIPEKQKFQRQNPQSSRESKNSHLADTESACFQGFTITQITDWKLSTPH